MYFGMDKTFFHAFTRPILLILLLHLLLRYEVIEERRWKNGKIFGQIFD